MHLLERKSGGEYLCISRFPGASRDPCCNRRDALRGGTFARAAELQCLPELWIPAREVVRKSADAPQISRFVVPAKAGTQGFQSLALGPRFRGGKIGECCRLDYSLFRRESGVLRFEIA